MQTVRDELQKTNKLLSGISGFLANLTLWGFLAAVLFFFSTQFAPRFFFSAGAVVAVLGIALALSSLHASGSIRRTPKRDSGYATGELAFIVALGLSTVGFFVAIAIFSR